MLNALQANPIHPPASEWKASRRPMPKAVPGCAWRSATRGNGFTTETALKAQEPFFSTRNVGLGIRADVARRILEAHQGKIDISPSSPGQEVAWFACFPWILRGRRTVFILLFPRWIRELPGLCDPDLRAARFSGKPGRDEVRRVPRLAHPAFSRKNWLLRLSIYGSLLAIVTYSEWFADEIEAPSPAPEQLLLAVPGSWAGNPHRRPRPAGHSPGQCLCRDGGQSIGHLLQPGRHHATGGAEFPGRLLRHHAAFRLHCPTDWNGERYERRSPSGAPSVFCLLTQRTAPLLRTWFLLADGLGLEWPDNTGIRTFATKARITYLTLNPLWRGKSHLDCPWPPVRP